MENLKSQIKFIHEMEAEELIEEAEEQARRIVKEAEEKVERIRQQKMQEVSERVKEKEASELAVTKLDGRKKILNIKSRLVEEAITKAMEKLKEIAGSGRSLYKESLQRLIVEAATKLNGNEFRILTNSRDEKFVKENLKELEKKTSKSKGTPVRLQVGEERLSAVGGAMVETKDKRQIFNNTIEARVALIKQEMVGKIFDNLFAGAKD